MSRGAALRVVARQVVYWNEEQAAYQSSRESSRERERAREGQ
jgi:hypothetical protein